MWFRLVFHSLLQSFISILILIPILQEYLLVFLLFSFLFKLLTFGVCNFSIFQNIKHFIQILLKFPLFLRFSTELLLQTYTDFKYFGL